MSLDFRSASEALEQMKKDLDGQTEAKILDGIQELVSKGLLAVRVIDEKPMLGIDYATNKLVASRSVEVKVFQDEYIQKLECENRELRRKVDGVTSIMEEWREDGFKVRTAPL
jgi:hypothetical protein